jgi:hypothetical protein
MRLGESSGPNVREQRFVTWIPAKLDKLFRDHQFQPPFQALAQIPLRQAR